MIIFKIEKRTSNITRWVMGEIFLRKYITTFNCDSKMIIFYRNQVNEANMKSEYIDETNDLKKDNSSFINIRIIVEIIMGIFIIIIFYLFVKRCRNKKRIYANELEDSNYKYITKENKEYDNLNKEIEMKNNNTLINFDSNQKTINDIHNYYKNRKLFDINIKYFKFKL